MRYLPAAHFSLPPQTRQGPMSAVPSTQAHLLAKSGTLAGRGRGVLWIGLTRPRGLPVKTASVAASVCCSALLIRPPRQPPFVCPQCAPPARFSGERDGTRRDRANKELQSKQSDGNFGQRAGCGVNRCCKPHWGGAKSRSEIEASLIGS